MSEIAEMTYEEMEERNEEKQRSDREVQREEDERSS